MKETPSPHVIDADTLSGGLKPIRQVILSLGSNLCDREANLQGAVDALRDTPDVVVVAPCGFRLEGAVSLAREVIAGDSQIDADDNLLHEECLKILALHQPVARDLRRIVAAMLITTDLERMGDLAEEIAERAIHLSGMPRMRPPEKLQRMADLTTSMVRQVLDSFVNLNRETSIPSRASTRSSEEPIATVSPTFGKPPSRRVTQPLTVVTPSSRTGSLTSSSSSCSGNAPATSNPITITDPGPQAGAEGSAVDLPIQATDSTGGTLSFTAQGLPPGLGIDPATGEITGTIHPGPFPVHVCFSTGRWPVSLYAASRTVPSGATANTVSEQLPIVNRRHSVGSPQKGGRRSL